MAAVERTGRDRVAWAHEHNIDARSLNAWRLNLARVPRTALRLVELVTEVATRPPPAPASAGCRVRHRDLVVEIDAGVDEEALVRVLRAVRGC